MKLRSAIFFAAVLGAVSSCKRTPAPQAPTTQPAPTAGHDAPRLVVLIVLDQLGSWVLDEHMSMLAPDGVIRHGIERGVYHRKVSFPYAGLYTAPGHALLGTGASPSASGVITNVIWDAQRSAEVATVDDAEHEIFGVPGRFGSPTVLKVDGVGDMLHAATGGKAAIAGLSYKDRGAILPTGKHADLALWYHKSIPGYTSSTYYMDALPPWLDAWQKAHPFEAVLAPWTPLDPDRLAAHLGPDSAPGEGNWEGLGKTFPHEPARSEAPYSTLRAVAASGVHLVELAREVIRQLHMGEDSVPDFLVLSVSSTDYIGHTFGPESWEYVDNLMRIDARLGEFVRELEARMPVSFVLTADHGVAPLPESSSKRGHKSGRIFGGVMVPELEAIADRELGPGHWVEAYVQPFVYLTPEGRASPDKARLLKVLAAHLGAQPELDRAVIVGSPPVPDDPVDVLVRASLPPDAPGDLFLVPTRWYVVDEDMPRGEGTSHGSPWDYDRDVPVIAWGPGVHPVPTGATPELSMRAVATSLAALLGVPPPPAAPPDPLPGIGAR